MSSPSQGDGSIGESGDLTRAWEIVGDVYASCGGERAVIDCDESSVFKRRARRSIGVSAGRLERTVDGAASELGS